MEYQVWPKLLLIFLPFGSAGLSFRWTKYVHTLFIRYYLVFPSEKKLNFCKHTFILGKSLLGPF